ncbi:MAG TPA: ChaN family lipoprotein [Bryobacteraceae bacterium]|nr:ChaN family lipoprotein [Bryobacteraceae bacterium]
MSFRSSAARKAVLRIVGAITVARAAVLMVGLTNESIFHAQMPKTAERPSFRLPDEAAGIDWIVQALISVFDQADIVALGEAHGRRADSELRIALVRHPDFAKKVRSIVVEFGSTTAQPTLDRYIRGENVSRAQLERVWKTTSNGVWDSPIYADFFTAVRDVNSRLPADARIRVFGGDPGPTDQRDRETAAVAVLEEQVLSKHGKALVIYGAAHFYRDAPATFGTSADLARTLEKAHPGRIYTVIPIGGELDPPPPGVSLRNPDYRKFESALKTQIRPVLIPLQRPPFRDFTAEEYLGGGIFSCVGPGGCRSAFAGSLLTLGQMADACVYLGIPQAGRDSKGKRSQ